MPEKANTRLLVAGIGLRGSGYPNACNTLRMLRDTLQIGMIKCGNWLPESTHLWKIAGGPRHKAFLLIIRLLSANTFSAIRLLLKHRTEDFVYVPYPGIFLLWLISWVPRRWRPRCICDTYITLWDSLYQDRNPGAAAGRFSRLLLRVETRALCAAEHLIVDTQANAGHIHQLFGVSRERIHAFPLALDASAFHAPSTLPTRANSKIRVVFVGTFVPLQGTTVIAQAIDMLRGHDNLEFVLIGDGQQADEAAPWLQDNPAVTWLRGWQPAQVLAEHLAQADICLGVFGGTGKAARVLPFKIYMALAAGKAIITQHGYGLPGGCPPLPVMHSNADAAELAAAIVSLAASGEQRRQLGLQASHYFQQYLSQSALAHDWKKLLGLGNS
jgi:glycosyltransferase involved in cell wall biosynthesis